jgi:hypothetical protein
MMQRSSNQRGSVQKQVTMAFYTPGPEDTSWVNKMVSLCSKYPYSHCELIFDNGLATSIMHGGNVFCKSRTFANANYTFRGFNVPIAMHDIMYNYACQQTADQIPFSSTAMLAPVLGCRLQRHVTGTFCSKYIVEVLQRGEIEWALSLQPDFCTPSSIFDALQTEKNVCFNTVPFKLNRMKIIY